MISVILPCYNAERYIALTIQSVLDQTYKNFELIIINDGSTDDSEVVIKSFDDQRIKYIVQENKGVGSTLRKGCELASGEFIARIDADDVCFSNRFEKQIQFLEHHPEIVLVSSAVVYIDEDGNETGRSFPYISNREIIKNMKFASTICHPAVMMRKSVYELAGGYKNVQPFEDMFLWLSMSKYGKLHNLKTPLIKYRILDNSISHSIPQNDKSKLLEFLLKNRNNDSFDSNIEVEYAQLYQKVKLDSEKFDHKIQIKIHNVPLLTKLERFIYRLLKNLKVSESLIESFIGTLKKYLSYIK